MQYSAWDRAQVRWKHNIRPTWVFSCLNSDVCNSAFPLMSSAEPEKWKDPGNEWRHGRQSWVFTNNKRKNKKSVFLYFLSDSYVVLPVWHWTWGVMCLEAYVHTTTVIFFFSLVIISFKWLTPFLYSFGFFSPVQFMSVWNIIFSCRCF